MPLAPNWLLLISIPAQDVCLKWTNIVHSDGIIVFSDNKYTLETIQGRKIRLIQEINSLLLSIETMRKSCIFQWILAHVDTEGNELADSLSNEARIIKLVPLSTMVFDANVVTKQKLCTNPGEKFLLPE